MDGRVKQERPSVSPWAARGVPPLQPTGLSTPSTGYARPKTRTRPAPKGLLLLSRSPRSSTFSWPAGVGRPRSNSVRVSTARSCFTASSGRSPCQAYAPTYPVARSHNEPPCPLHSRLMAGGDESYTLLAADCATAKADRWRLGTHLLTTGSSNGAKRPPLFSPGFVTRRMQSKCLAPHMDWNTSPRG